MQNCVAQKIGWSSRCTPKSKELESSKGFKAIWSRNVKKWQPRMVQRSIGSGKGVGLGG